MSFILLLQENRQRLGIGANDPDRLNYMTDAFFGSTDPRSEFPTGTVPCNHRDWMNPQGIGFDSATDFHPVICVGSIHDEISFSMVFYMNIKVRFQMLVLELMYGRLVYMF